MFQVQLIHLDENEKKKKKDSSILVPQSVP